MTTPQKTSHWKSIAELLGAPVPVEPASQAPVAEPPSAESPLPAGETLSAAPAAVPASALPPVSEAAAPPPTPARPVKPAAPPRRPRADWRSLAGMLGLGGAPEPETPPSPPPGGPEPPSHRDYLGTTEPVSAEPLTAEPLSREAEVRGFPGARRDLSSELDRPSARERSGREQSERERSERERSEPSELAASHWTEHVEARLEPVDPLEMPASAFVEEVVDAEELEDIESESGIPSVSADESASEERRRRRRRRRRRGRRAESEGGGEELPRTELTSPPEELDEFARADFEEVEEPRDEEEPRAAGEPGEEPSPEEPGREEGRRRRRRRRRGRRGDRAEGERPAGERAGSGETRLQARPPAEELGGEDSGDEDETLADVLGESEDEIEGEGKDGEFHLSHKKIPSWQEAIEIVVTTNMAERAKHPSRDRGGRGRRDR